MKTLGLHCSLRDNGGEDRRASPLPRLHCRAFAFVRTGIATAQPRLRPPLRGPPAPRKLASTASTFEGSSSPWAGPFDCPHPHCLPPRSKYLP